MATKWKKVYLFISSTFKDMNAERDYVLKRVIPKLQDWCDLRRLWLIDIDLRWGLTNIDSQNKKIIHLCLKYVDQCRPFFLCFLGEKYGWIPQEQDISKNTFEEFPILKNVVKNQEMSATGLEILHAIGQPFHLGKQSSCQYPIFFYRDPNFLDNKDFVNNWEILNNWYLDEKNANKQQKLKQEIIPQALKKLQCDDNIYMYQCTWNSHDKTPELAIPLRCPSINEKRQQRWRESWEKANIEIPKGDLQINKKLQEKADVYNANLTKGRLGNFTCDNMPLDDAIIDLLQQNITKEYPDHVKHQNISDLQRELDLQDQFLFLASETFIERNNDFVALDDYVNSDSKKTFILIGQAGAGKSTLLAKWVDRYQKQEQNETIHIRFIGVSDGANSIARLQYFLLQELQSIGKWKSDVPLDPQELGKIWPLALEECGSKGRTIFVIDALNQLDTKLVDLEWILSPLPKNVKIITSFKTGEVEGDKLYRELCLDDRKLISSVPLFCRNDQKKLVNIFLRKFLKELDHECVDALLDTPGAKNPLYLKIVLTELRIFGSSAQLCEKIQQDFGHTPKSAFFAVLKRLENDTAYSKLKPRIAVSLIFGFLSHARRGLSAKELSCLLQKQIKEDLNFQDFEDAVQLYLRQVRYFTARRNGKYDFFYDSFKIAACERYVQSSKKENDYQKSDIDWHQQIADYFYEQGLGSQRTLSELPYHLTCAKAKEKLLRVLSDFNFLEKKCLNRMIYQLSIDFEYAFAKLSKDSEQIRIEIAKSVWVTFKSLELIAQALNFHLNFLFSSPHCLFQNLWNYGYWYDSPEAAKHYCDTDLNFNTRWNSDFDKFCQLVEYWRDKYQGTWLKSLRPLPVDLGSPIKKFFMDYQEAVVCMEISYDNNYIVAGVGFPSESVSLVDVKSEKIYNLEKHGDVIYDVAFNYDNQYFASLSKDQAVRIWNVHTKVLEKKVELRNPALSIAFCRNRNWIAIGEATDYRFRMSEIYLWDVNENKKICAFSIPKQEDFGGFMASYFSGPGNDDALCITFSKNNKWIAAGLGNNTIQIWSITNIEEEPCLPIYCLNGHEKAVSCIDFSHDSRFLVSGSKDKTVRLWDIEKGICKVLKGHDEEVNSVCFNPDDSLVVSGGSDNAIKLWITESHRLIFDIIAHSKSVIRVTFSANGSSLISASHDGTIKKLCVKDCLYSAIRFSNPLELKSQGEYISFSEWEFNNRYFCTSAVRNNSIAIWDSFNGEQIHFIANPASLIKETYESSDEFPQGDFYVSNMGNKLFYSRKDRTQIIFFLEKKVVKNVKKGRFFGCSRDDRFIALKLNSDIKIWDLKKNKLLRDIKNKTWLHSGRFSDDYRHFICQSKKIIKIWDLKKGNSFVCPGEESIEEIIGYSKNGKWIATILQGHLRIWDRQTGNLYKTIVSKNESISARFSLDGRLVAIIECEELEIWDCYKEKFVYKIAVAKFIEDVSFSCDSKYIIVQVDGDLQVWSLRSRKPIKVFSLRSSQARALIKNYSLIVANSNHGTIRRFSLKNNSNEPERTIYLDEQDSIWCIAYSPCERKIVTGSKDKTICLWNIDEENHVQTLKGHEAGVTCISFSPDGNKIVSGSEDKSLRIWNAESGRIDKILKFHSGAIKNVDFVNNSQILSISTDHTVCLSSVNDGKLIHQSVLGSQRWIKNLTLNKHGNKFAVATADNHIRVWNTEIGNLQHTIKNPDESVQSIDFSPDGRLLGCGARSGKIFIVDTSNKKIIRKFYFCDEWIETLCFSFDGKYLVTGSRNNAVRVWDVTKKKPLHCLEKHCDWIEKLSYSHNQHYIASGARDNTVCIWNSLTGELLWSFCVQNYITSIQFDNKGRYVASGTKNCDIYIWDLKKKKLHLRLPKYSGVICSLVFSTDDRLLFSSSNDCRICIWDVESGQLINVLHGHNEQIDHIVFSSDKQTLISSSYDKTIRFWNITSGKCLKIVSTNGDFHSIAVAAKRKLYKAITTKQGITIEKGDNVPLAFFPENFAFPKENGVSNEGLLAGYQGRNMYFLQLCNIPKYYHRNIIKE